MGVCIVLVALLSLSSWCLVMVVWLFLAVPWVCLRFVIVVFPDHTHLLLLLYILQDSAVTKMIHVYPILSAQLDVYAMDHVIPILSVRVLPDKHIAGAVFLAIPG